MKKTLLATSVALTLGIIAPSANAAFTPLSAGNYTLNITSGCNKWGNCQEFDDGSYVDNIESEATTTVTSDIVTTRAIGSTIGSGIAGDGLLGVIDFSIDNSGNISVSSYNQDSDTVTAGGILYFDALGASGTSAMTGNIGTDGSMTFTPTGREAMYENFASGIGVQEWNRDALSGLYDTYTTGTSTNRNKGNSASFTLTGTALSDNGMGGWTGSLVFAGNYDGNTWTGFNNLQISQLWNISITAAPAVPLPAAAWLFGSGLLGMIGIARRRTSS